MTINCNIGWQRTCQITGRKQRRRQFNPSPCQENKRMDQKLQRGIIIVSQVTLKIMRNEDNSFPTDTIQIFCRRLILWRMQIWFTSSPLLSSRQPYEYKLHPSFCHTIVALTMRGDDDNLGEKVKSKGLLAGSCGSTSLQITGPAAPLATHLIISSHQP